MAAQSGVIGAAARKAFDAELAAQQCLQDSLLQLYNTVTESLYKLYSQLPKCCQLEQYIESPLIWDKQTGKHTKPNLSKLDDDTYVNGRACKAVYGCMYGIPGRDTPLVVKLIAAGLARWSTKLSMGPLPAQDMTMVLETYCSSSRAAYGRKSKL